MNRPKGGTSRNRETMMEQRWGVGPDMSRKSIYWAVEKMRSPAPYPPITWVSMEAFEAEIALASARKAAPPSPA